jgi:hypothetical protein
MQCILYIYLFVQRHTGKTNQKLIKLVTFRGRWKEWGMGCSSRDGGGALFLLYLSPCVYMAPRTMALALRTVVLFHAHKNKEFLKTN